MGKKEVVKKKEPIIVKLLCYRYSIDWVQEENVSVDLNKYVFFSAEYRLGTWYLTGHYTREDMEPRWTSEDVSIHGIASRRELARFIVQANDLSNNMGCKVSRFNSMHYEEYFYEELQALLKLVQEEKELLEKQREGESQDSSFTACEQQEV